MSDNNSDDVDSAIDELDADESTDADESEESESAPAVEIEEEPFRPGGYQPIEATPAEDSPAGIDSEDALFDEIDPGDSEGDVFTEMAVDTASLDDDIFDLLEDASDDDGPIDALEAQEIEAADAEGVVVPKSQYCEQCEHFSDPPEMDCHNPGTEIHELTDMDHVRISNCPIVAERGQLTSSSGD